MNGNGHHLGVEETVVVAFGVRDSELLGSRRVLQREGGNKT